MSLHTNIVSIHILTHNHHYIKILFADMVLQKMLSKTLHQSSGLLLIVNKRERKSIQDLWNISEAFARLLKVFNASGGVLANQMSFEGLLEIFGSFYGV